MAKSVDSMSVNELVSLLCEEAYQDGKGYGESLSYHDGYYHGSDDHGYTAAVLVARLESLGVDVSAVPSS